uniref:SFRICE_033823 n=1 Tax=Spodoptera frugiperda TaxID=7108 RepID=A0A2H1WGD1_SPOFR
MQGVASSVSNIRDLKPQGIQRERPQAIARIAYDVISTHRMYALPMMRSVRCGSVDAVYFDINM